MREGKVLIHKETKCHPKTVFEHEGKTIMQAQRNKRRINPVGNQRIYYADYVEAEYLSDKCFVFTTH